MTQQPNDTAVEKREVHVQAGPRPIGGLIPRNLEELGALSHTIFKSALAPKGFSKESIAVAVMMGMEVGLSPMQALQNIAVINGKPSIYGDAALGLCRASGLMADFAETRLTDDTGNVVGYHCMAKRDGQEALIEHSFTIEDAKRAKLWNKSGPWTEYPQRMLQMRARSWVLRDGFADVLKGLSIREEVIDTPAQVIATVDDPLSAGVHDLALPAPVEVAAESAPAPEKPKKKRKTKKKADEAPPEDPPTPSPGDATPVGGPPAFSAEQALETILEYSGGAREEKWKAFMAACKPLGIDHDAPEEADEGPLQELLSYVLDMKAKEE